MLIACSLTCIRLSRDEKLVLLELWELLVELIQKIEQISANLSLVRHETIRTHRIRKTSSDTKREENIKPRKSTVV